MSEHISVRVLEHAGAWISTAFRAVARQSTLDAARAAFGAQGYRNRLLNSAFSVNQRLVSSNTDDTYAHDRWYVLTQSAAIAVTTLTDPESGRPTGARLTQSNATPQRIGYAQIVESGNIRDLRGKAAALAARIRCSSAQAIRMAILEWTGTADTVTSDIVADWNSTNFTTGNFFNAATLSLVAIGSTTPQAATWTDMTQVSGNFSASLNNAIIFIWTEGTLAQNATLDIDETAFVEGARASYQPRTFDEELRACLRYYQKSFPYATAPAQNAGTTGAVVFPSEGASTNHRVALRPIAPLRSGTHTRTYFNPSAANAQARDTDAGADCTGTATSGIVAAGDSGGALFFATPAGSAVGNAIAVHYTFDAEL